MKPRYPVFVLSKGRADCCLTSRFLTRDGVAHRVVVEPPELEAYAATVGSDRLLELPFANLGLGSIPARNWVWQRAREEEAERHWIIDDNIHRMRRMFRGKRIPCEAGPALRAMEDFADRYENVALAGPAYSMFAFGGVKIPPLYLNCHVYSCILVRCDLPFAWRGRYNEDTDLCLQALSRGYCTVLFNAFMIDKVATLTMRGGNTDQLYAGDGRLRMARSLQRAWPYVVAVKRRFKRPQHVVRNTWRHFDTALKLKSGIDLAQLRPNEYGLNLTAMRPPKSAGLRRLLRASRLLASAKKK